jgi:hypothetical protein
MVYKTLGNKKPWSFTSLVGTYVSLFEAHITLGFRSEFFTFIFIHDFLILSWYYRYCQSDIDTHFNISVNRNCFGIRYRSNELHRSLDYDGRKWHEFLDPFNWFNDCSQWQHIDDGCIHRYHNEEM